MGKPTLADRALMDSNREEASVEGELLVSRCDIEVSVVATDGCLAPCWRSDWKLCFRGTSPPGRDFIELDPPEGERWDPTLSSSSSSPSSAMGSNT